MTMKKLASMLDDPPRENSEDFTTEDALRATPTTDADDLVGKIMCQVRGSKVSKFAVQSHELRRRNDHMYCRVRLVATHEPDKVLVYQIDWVTQ
jgi:hypothetical protein